MEIRNLSKKYGKRQILSNINFSLKRGQVMGILGPNGAGKTTLLKIICGLVRPSGGEVLLDGVNRNQIATIFEDQRFLGYLSGLKNMKLFFSSIYRRQFSLQEMFHGFGLDESKDVKVKVYSSGMKKRLDLMSVFFGGKKLFLLDEPTNALDIDHMIWFKQQVISLKKEGKSFIIASHHSQELEQICDFFLLINRGTIVAQMSNQEVFSNFDSLEAAYGSLIHKDHNQ